LSEDAEKLEDFGTDSAAEWRRWDRELDLADKAEEDWRSEVKSVMKIYRTETETSTDRS
jgi:N6-adenosine-specific RNA methylase IME4